MKFSRVTGLVLTVVLLLPSSLAFPQQPAEMNVERHKEIVAGDTVPFTVKVEKAPNLAGTFVSVTFAPEEPYPGMSGTGANAQPINPGSTLYRGEVTIPVTARTGSWHVVEVTLGLPAAPSKPLKFNDVRFDVKENTNLILPDSARVQIGRTE
jgi:uncharacterized protein (DUF58 family)